MTKIDLQLFGAFKALGQDASFELPDNANLADLSMALEHHIHANGGAENLIDLISVSRFATEQEVLPKSYQLENGMKLAIIPPVSGG